MYLAAITSKANSGGSEDNCGSNGSMPGVDELFESRIMFDIVRFVQRENLDGMGMLYGRIYTGNSIMMYPSLH